MQSTFLSSSSHSITTQFHQYPCPKSSPFQIPTTNNSNKTPNFLPKTITLTKSLRTSINYEHHHHQGGLGDDCGPLPVVIKQSGKVSRYFWDGNLVKLVSVDVSGDGSGLSDGLGGWVRNLLLPKEVNENYMEYVKWKFVHRVFSSALKVLATQAMFRAIGVGYARSLPSAAALNWVLKDGLGRLSRCIYTASLASAFDTNLKRVRFTTAVLFSLSIGVELLTPVFPRYFLVLASIANIAKQISLACYLATGSAVHRSFAIKDNLGEVSAKAQIQ